MEFRIPQYKIGMTVDYLASYIEPCCKDLNTQVQAIRDLILSDLQFDEKSYNAESISFGKHLYCTKFWFVRISWSNKKRFLLSLIKRVKSAWTLSLLLQSLWNCRPKDAYMSVSRLPPLTGYDQVPFDHDRTAIPPQTLIKVVMNDRRWFHGLDAQSQAMVLSELLTVSGGPIMWEVLDYTTNIYNNYKNRLLADIAESVTIEPEKIQPHVPDKHEEITPVEKELNERMAVWLATLKSIKDGLKLEELELTFTDGTKKKMWKVNRPTPEGLETVDRIQLLPSSISKRIMSFIPKNQWPELTKVNKYWAFLIDELNQEFIARDKLNAEIKKMKDLIFRYDSNSADRVSRTTNFMTDVYSSKSSVKRSMMPQPSEKSAKYSMRYTLLQKKEKKRVPIRSLKEFRERLQRRGALDEHLFSWCSMIVRKGKKLKYDGIYGHEGVLSTHDITFPCPLLAENIDIPLNPPLFKDPSTVEPKSLQRNISNTSLASGVGRNSGTKRFNIWSKDFSSLYKVLKVPNYH